MLSSLKHHYRVSRLAWKFLVHEELKSPTPVPLNKRLSLLRRGYHGQAWELYDLTHYPLIDYFSDWAKARMSMMYDGRNVRAGYQYGLNNKIFSTAILGHYLRVPAIYAIVEHGSLVRLHPTGSEMFKGSWMGACRVAGGTLVVKPSAEGRGRGVFVLADRDGELVLDGVRVTEQEIDRKIKTLNEYIIVEFLHQGQYAASLYPEATNTIRMVTIIDPATHKPFLATAIQRIGRAASQPVDNWNRGGLCAAVDLETGTLSRAAARETAQRRLAWHDVHPDTGMPIKGMKVPQWEVAQQKILETAACLAYYKFLSWDVVVMDDGIAVIEADTVSGIETLQVHRPLLRDARVRRCFAHYGYVRGKTPAPASQKVLAK
ncbi:MAG: hypothetical protein VR64_23820 [Desulfatitalea sp. BRH_c12]|nr:MAG: hypothetical protein VR64_23820 [Desulfatitalea sp. BRH_c12]